MIMGGTPNKKLKSKNGPCVKKKLKNFLSVIQSYSRRLILNISKNLNSRTGPSILGARVCLANSKAKDWVKSKFEEKEQSIRI